MNASEPSKQQAHPARRAPAVAGPAAVSGSVPVPDSVAATDSDSDSVAVTAAVCVPVPVAVSVSVPSYFNPFHRRPSCTIFLSRFS